MAKYLFIGLFAFVLTSAQVSSTVSFRLKLADYYKNRHQYAKAVQIYGRILRKDLVKKNLPGEIFANVNFDLGYLAARIDLTNLAIEAYAKASAKILYPDLDRYYGKTDLARDKLLPIGMLEAGRFEPAIKEFRNLALIYPNFRDAEKFINAAGSLAKQKISPDTEGFLFYIGDGYIQNQLFDEARSFFTRRILDYGADPIRVLKYVEDKYSQDLDVKTRVWGSDIFVTLEDFETTIPQMTRWIDIPQSEIREYGITGETAHGGSYSQLLHIEYSSSGKGRDKSDYWQKMAMIPLDDSNLGIRLFIKGARLSSQTLCLNVIFPKPEKSAIINSDLKRDAGSGWTEYRFENIPETGKDPARRFNWNTEGMFIDRILFNTLRISDRFCIDDIELYLVNK